MNSNEFWCRAFLAAMTGNYTREEPGLDHATNARYCDLAADAALAVAQRRGMVTASACAQRIALVDPTTIEFTAKRDGDLWMLISPELAGVITVHSEQLTYPLGGGVVAHIAWGETCPPKPIEVRLVRSEGA